MIQLRAWLMLGFVCAGLWPTLLHLPTCREKLCHVVSTMDTLARLGARRRLLCCCCSTAAAAAALSENSVRMSDTYMSNTIHTCLNREGGSFLFWEAFFFFFFVPLSLPLHAHASFSGSIPRITQIFTQPPLFSSLFFVFLFSSFSLSCVVPSFFLGDPLFLQGFIPSLSRFWPSIVPPLFCRIARYHYHTRFSTLQLLCRFIKYVVDSDQSM